MPDDDGPLFPLNPEAALKGRRDERDGSGYKIDSRTKVRDRDDA